MKPRTNGCNIDWIYTRFQHYIYLLRSKLTRTFLSPTTDFHFFRKEKSSYLWNWFNTLQLSGSLDKNTLHVEVESKERRHGEDVVGRGNVHGQQAKDNAISGKHPHVNGTHQRSINCFNILKEIVWYVIQAELWLSAILKLKIIKTITLVLIWSYLNKLRDIDSRNESI